MYRYYSIHRPVGPGTFPKPAGNTVVNHKNFDGAEFCEQIGRKAWGYVEYENPVSPDLLQKYELLGIDEERKYTVEITTVTTLTVVARCEDEAIEDACDRASSFAPDKIDAKIIQGVDDRRIKAVQLGVADKFDKVISYGEKDRYPLLGRMKSDCEYFLGYGNRCEKHLWGKNVSEHIAYMKALWLSFPTEGKPEWLTFEEIEAYEKRMLHDG